MTKIEWTDKTWNPIIGCSHISPACDHCYAERMAARLAQNPKAPTEYQRVVQPGKPWTWNGKTALVGSALDTPLHWRKPCRVFVGSMTDLFHPSTPFAWVNRVFEVMAGCPHITFQILTKRPERMREYVQRPSCPVRHDKMHSDAWYDGEGCEACGAPSARELFRQLWESIYPGSWERNDWVWVTEFERTERPEGWPHA